MKQLEIMGEFRIIKFNYQNSSHKDEYHSIIEHLFMYKQFTRHNNEIKRLYHIYMPCLLVIFPKLKEILGLEITKSIIYFWLDSENTEINNELNLEMQHIFNSDDDDYDPILDYDSDGRDESFFTDY